MNSSESPSVFEKASQDWIDACEFHDLRCQEVLRQVADGVSKLKEKADGQRAAHPLILLDLDSTLYEVGPRTHQILKEWVNTEDRALHDLERQGPRSLKSLVEAARSKQIGYSLSDTFRNLGLDPEAALVRAALKSAKPFWQQRFFTSQYLRYDHAYPGAAEFVRELYRLGSEIVYLTGRDEPGMGDGTRENLLRDGFPWGVERTHLLLKPQFEIPDVEHKKNAADYIKTHGSLVASFENEPKNLVALYELFPQAMHVFVHTVYSDHPAIPVKGLYRILGFT